MERIAVWEIGRTGWSAQGYPYETQSGLKYGQSRLTTYSTDLKTALDGYLEMSNGAIIIDKRPIADSNRFIQQVLSAPLLELGPNPTPIDVSKGTSIMIDAIANESGNAFGSLIRGARQGNVNFDGVNLQEYFEYWQRLGAKVKILLVKNVDAKEFELNDI